MIEKIEILQHSEGGYLSSHSCEETLRFHLISCKFLADFEDFSELCDEVVHVYDNSN